MSIKQVLEDNKDQIIADYISGISTNKIAKQFNCNPGNVYFCLKKWNIELRTLGRGRVANIKEKITALYFNNLSAYAIAKQLEVKKSTILKHLKTLGFSTAHLSDQRKDPLINHKDKIIQEYLQGASTTALTKKYHCGNSSIWALLQKNGIKCRLIRQFTFDEKFLDNIGEAQAYFLGWAFTDGNNRRDGFRLTICDKDVLETFKNILQYKGDIKEIPARNERCHKQYSLEIFSRVFAKRLTELGCHPNKSHTVKWPSYIKGDLVRPFIQGCLEGDGSITKNYVNFTGNKYLLGGIHAQLIKLLDIKCKWYKRNNSWGIFISKKVDRIKFLNWVYSTASVYMERKYQHYLGVINSSK